MVRLIIFLIQIRVVLRPPSLLSVLGKGPGSASSLQQAQTRCYVIKTDEEPSGIIRRLEHPQEAHSPEHGVTAAAAASGRDYSRHVRPENSRTQGHTCSHTHPDDLVVVAAQKAAFVMFITK